MPRSRTEDTGETVVEPTVSVAVGSHVILEVMLYYVVGLLHCTTTLHYITLCCTILYYTDIVLCAWCGVVLCYIVLHYIMLY